ncbi:hypothetical protein [Candidatus Enterococcus clewellii]|nr:hypothetical protein [Enterococcus sp. 9E7_DIV0242]OTP11663.1 hypothetical protein A5888_003762 [Enterococcus sp. 9E7_DIV0242]
MEIKLNVLIEEDRTTIQFGNESGTIEIIKKENEEIVTKQPAVCFLLKQRAIVDIIRTNEKLLVDKEDFDEVIAVTPSWEIELPYLEQFLIVEARKNGLPLEGSLDEVKVPGNRKKTVAAYGAQLLQVLQVFGYKLKPIIQPEVAKESKSKSTKARHRWSKAISEIEFFIDTRESKATVLWQKRNEMLLKAGAQMMPSAPLNKDGSLGFAAKMGEKIRADHAGQIKEFKTTEDVILKSVNEVGLFLYFGGTNSWLEMVDKEGKTINEWTVID